MVDKALMSSKSEFWCTPASVLAPIRKLHEAAGVIQLDPCSGGYSVVNAVEEWLPPAHNGLTEDWTLAAKGGLVFVNPPYGRGITGLWTKKIQEEASKGCTIVALLPARTDTKWFQNMRPQLTVLIKGRIKFIDGITGETKDAAPFPSCLMYFGDFQLAAKAALVHLGLTY